MASFNELSLEAGSGRQGFYVWLKLRGDWANRKGTATSQSGTNGQTPTVVESRTRPDFETPS